MFRKYFSVAAIALLASSCADDNFKVNEPSLPGDGITFVADETSSVASSRTEVSTAVDTIMLVDESGADPLAVIVETAPIATTKAMTESLAVGRSTPVNDANPLTSFRVYAFKYPTDGSANGKFFDAEVKNVSGSWSYEPVRYWPDDCTLGFFGIAPVDIEPTIVSESDWSIDYTVSPDPTQQPDLMTAKTANTLTQNNGLVNMTFQHLLSQINFRVNSELTDGTTINSITLDGVHGSGSYNFSGNSGSWTINSGSQTITVDNLDTDGGNVSVNKPDHTLMLLPQNDLSTVTLTVALSNDKTKSATLSGSWVAGTAYTYSINIKPDYSIEFTDVPTQPLDCHYTRCAIKVNAKNLQGKSWTIESDQPWCTVRASIEPIENEQGFWIRSPRNYPTTSADVVAEYKKYIHSTTLSNPVSESGEKIIYVFLEENTSDVDRKATLSVMVVNESPNANELVASTSILQSAPYVANGYWFENIDEDGELPWGFNWNRKVVYDGQKTSLTGWYYHYIGANLRAWNYESQYSGYKGITITSAKGILSLGSTMPTITIDYGEMTPDAALSGSVNGQHNTYLLYTNAGGNVIGLEEILQSNSRYFKLVTPPEEAGSLENVKYYAALACIKKNAFDIKVEENTNEGETAITPGVVVNENDIVWYLPAQAESGAFVNAVPNWVTPNPWSENKLWTSSPGSDHTHAWLYQGSLIEVERSTPARVRAVRKPQ